jgi:hypothetical protein
LDCIAGEIGYQPSKEEIGKALRLSANQVEMVVRALAMEERRRRAG